MPLSSSRITSLDDVGNPDAPQGSQPWSRWFVLQAKRCRKDLSNEAASLARLINKLESGEAWKPLGLASFSMLCELEIGISQEEIDAIRNARMGDTIEMALAEIRGPAPEA